MKKILVLVLALLCVFSVAAFATETEEAFTPNYGAHVYYASLDNADDKFIGRETVPGGFYATFAGSNGASAYYKNPSIVSLYGKTEGDCETGTVVVLKCMEENCTAGGYIKVTISDAAHTMGTHLDKDVANKAATCTETGIKVWECGKCGERWEEIIPMTEHHYSESTTEPDCVTPGYITYDCDFCDNVYTEENAPALKHDFSKYEMVVIKPATCLEAGKAAWLNVCQNEGCNATEEGVESYYIDLPVINHLDADENEWLQLYLEDGDEVIFDIRFAAGFDFVDEDGDYIADVNAQGIPYVENVDSSAVSALLAGTKYAVVTGAGEDGLFGTADDVETNVQLHGEYTFKYTAPKCEVEGSLVITCKNCGASVTYAVEALEHDYQIIKVNYLTEFEELDCTKGYKVYVECVVDGCDVAFQQNTVKHDEHEDVTFSLYQKLGNNTVVESPVLPVADYKVAVGVYMVDCLPFTVTYYCDCQLETANGIVLDAFCTYEHDVNKAATEEHTIDWASDKVYKYVAPTCKEAGYVLYTCSECFTPDRVDYAIDEDGHAYDEIEWTTVPAKCDEDGLKSGVCPICEETLEEVIPMTGHDWDHEEEDYTKWNKKASTCTVDGKYYRTCATCDKEESVVIPAGHTYPTKNGKIDAEKCVSYTAPTCTTYGEVSYYCVVCHDPVANEQIPMLKHEMVKGKKVADQTCCVAAQYLYSCDNCDAIEVRTVGNPAGHSALTEAQITSIKAEIAAGVNSYTNVIYLVHATCETPGEGYKLCANLIQVYEYDEEAEEAVVVDSYTCDYEYGFEIPALSHMWEVEQDDDGTFYCVCEGVGEDEFGNIRYGCGATDKIEVRAPIYEIAIEGKVGTLTKADDNMSDLQEPVYVRIVYDFQTKDGVSTSLIFMADAKFVGENATFKVPVIKTGMTMTGASYIVVTDADADEMRYSQITNKYGELNL